jgi:hypothetical protein
MDATEYKAAKGSPGVIRSDVLETILGVVSANDPTLASTVREQLSSEPIELPAGHNQAPGSVWLRLTLGDDLAEAVLDCLVDSEISAVGSDGSTNAAASYAAGLVDAWQYWMEHNEA